MKLHLEGFLLSWDYDILWNLQVTQMKEGTVYKLLTTIIINI